MTALAIWTALKRLPWRWIGTALCIAGLLYAAYSWSYARGSHSRDAEVAALNTTIANMRAASAEALAQNKADVARINALQDQVTKDKNNDAPKQLADARAALAAYVVQHPAKADSDRTGSDRASGVSDAPGEPDAAPTQAIVSVIDLDACAQAYVTATGLQDWIRTEAAIQR